MISLLLILMLVQAQDTKQQVSSIDALVESIDSLVTSDTGGLLVLGRSASTGYHQVKSDADWPEDVTASFNVFQDSLGRIRYLVESPFSQSGDWNAVYTYYFDGDGNTIHFIYYTSFLNSECADILRERKTYYYAPGFKLIYKTSQLTDGKFNVVDSAGCVFSYRFKPEEYRDSRDFPKSLLLAIERYGRAAP